MYSKHYNNFIRNLNELYRFILQKFSDWNLSNKYVFITHIFVISSILVLLSYAFASFLNILLVWVITRSIDIKQSYYFVNYDTNVVNVSKNINYIELKKYILNRNLFNSNGELPQESVILTHDASNKFDINAECTACSLPIKLVGTIYLTSGQSIAVIKEQGVDYADIYRENEVLITDDSVIIVKIEPNKVIFNNKGVKECLEIVPALANSDEITVYDGDSANADNQPQISISDNSASSKCNNIVLEHSYVMSELGEGFAEILKKGRLIPYTIEGSMKGFKLIGVDPNSLFGKVCLKNGDIITEVNDISLQQPEQGFAFYQVFQDEKQIRINGLRGEKPFSIYVEIK